MMKIKLKKSIMLDILVKIQGITNRKTNNAITNCVLIKAVENTIKVFVTDYETGFTGSYTAEVEKEGEVVINARKLFEIVRDFSTEDILVTEIDNYWIEISNHNIQYNIVGMNPELFPIIPEIAEISFIEIESKNLKKMINKTSFLAPSVDEKRAHVIGVCLETFQKEGKNWLRTVSTDGNRLAKVEFSCINESSISFDRSFLVKKKGFNELSKIIVDEDLVFLGKKENKLFVKNKQETVSIQLLNGLLPEYDAVLAKKKEANQIILNNSLFLMMLKRMSIFSSEEYRGVFFNFNDNRLIVHSTSPEVGESKEEMFIEYTGKPTEAVFNPKYFIEALNAIEDEKIILSIIDHEMPCFIEGEKDDSFIYLIMPMRV